jgi:hypothetical protein
MENEIKTAADWWTKQLSGTKQDAKLGGNVDMLLAVAAIIGSRDISEKRSEAFHCVITEMLTVNFNNGRNTQTLSVDYGPKGILLDASRVAGIDSILPMKTCMWIKPGSVTVSHGYGASAVEIFED